MPDKLDRSAKSMEEVFAAIREALRIRPNLRVGQIIANACIGAPDLFYVENGDLAARIRSYTREPSDHERKK